jgi:hypothetical protein
MPLSPLSFLTAVCPYATQFCQCGSMTNQAAVIILLSAVFHRFPIIQRNKKVTVEYDLISRVRCVL